MTTSPAIRLMIGVAVAAVAFATSTRADVQRDFFQALETGDVKQVTRQMSPDLLIEVDEPILDAWMKALSKRVGPLQSIKYTGLELTQTDSGPMRITTANVTFENGSATSTLTALGGQLVAFDVSSDQLDGDWFEGPTSTDIYQQMGRTFIERFIGGDADNAYAMCHEALQEVIDRESFQQMIDIVQSKTGSLNSVTFKDSRMKIDDESQNLLLNFEIAAEQGTSTCEINVQFVGMKGYLLGFNFE